MRSTKTVLLAEDDMIDQETIKRAFKKLRISNRLIITNNGEEALVYLKNTSHEKPCMLLLDLKMPKMGGLELLKIMKADDELKMIPVVVFTSSNEENDKLESFGLGVVGYIIKPVDYQKLVEAIKTIDLYWTLSELPPDSEQL